MTCTNQNPLFYRLYKYLDEFFFFIVTISSTLPLSGTHLPLDLKVYLYRQTSSSCSKGIHCWLQYYLL